MPAYRCIDIKPIDNGNLVTVEVEHVPGKPMRFWVTILAALPAGSIDPGGFSQVCVAALQFGMTLTQIKAKLVTVVAEAL